MAIHSRNSLATIQSGIDRRLPFKAASMSGEIVPDYGVDEFGRMEWSERQPLMDAHAAGKLAYLVRSYQTPVAWCDSEGNWTITETRHSATTQNHLTLIRTASANPGFYAR